MPSLSSTWRNVTKTDPCPLCGKPDWCSVSGDLEAIVCRRTDAAPDGWTKLPKQSSDGGNIFVKQSKKAPRQRATRQWIYRDRNGSPIVRVQRTDDGQGGKTYRQQRWDAKSKGWVSGTAGIDRADIPVYRYQEIQAAISNGEPIFITEGEGCADALWAMGLAATCNIGGSKKFAESDAADLKGASIVICPDRDKPGVEHAEAIAQFFPEASWLYAFPDSYWWQHLPPSQGLDIADWIEQGASREDILAAVEERRTLAPVTPAREAVQPRTPDTMQLTIEQAVQQARIILRETDNEIAANVRLESLRRACGMGDYSWSNNIIRPLKREMEGDRFKLELLALLQMEDAIERERLIAQLAPKYSMSAGRIEKALGLMRQRAQTPETKVLDLDELFDLEIEALDWLVPGILPARETIVLAGAPKSGKTLASIDLAFCIATGEDAFLGEAVKQGKVLLVSTDESPTSTRNKLLNRGFRKQDKDRIKIMPNWDISQMAQLEKILEEFKPDLTIIDSLRRINKGSEISENSAEFADNIYSLKETLSRYGSAGVLVHHTNKNREALGVDRLRGSSAIAGAVWGVWQLDQIPKPDPNNKKRMIVDPKDPKRVLSVFARDAEGQQLTIELNLENSSWRNLGSGESEEEAANKVTIRDRILNILAANPSPMTGKAIIEALDGAEVAPNSVYNELSSMERKRLINSKPAPGDKRYKVFSLPKAKNHLPPLPPPLSVSNMTNFAETLTEREIEDSHVDSHVIVMSQTGTLLPEIAETPTQSKVENSHTLSTGTRGGGVEELGRPAPTVTSTHNFKVGDRKATSYEEVEAAKAQYPGLTKEAAKFLTPEEIKRIKALKPEKVIAAQPPSTPEPKSPERELAERLIAVASQEEFEEIAKNYTGSPKDRELVEDAITIADVCFGRKCELKRWWEILWRNH